MISDWTNTYTHTDTGTASNTTYYYRIKFRNADGAETVTYYESVDVVSIAPAAPSNFTAAGATDTTITWQWTDNAVDEHGVEVQDDANAKMLDAAADATTVEESGLSENTQYSRHCHAYREIPGRIYSGASGSTTMRTKVHDPTASDFTLTHLGNGQVQVAVNAPVNSTTGSTGVYIERDGDGDWAGADYVIVGGAWTTTYTQTETVTTGSTWQYRITFRNADGDLTAVSPVKTITPTVPAAPSGFTGTAASTISITWQWADNSTDESGFEVQDSSDTNKAEAAADATSVTEPGMSENTAYTRHCHAYNVPDTARNYSGPSETATKYTLVDAPLDSDWTCATTATDVTITITAPPSSTSGDTGVKVERADDADFTVNVTPIQNFIATYSLTDTPPGTGTFYYRITFRNGDAVETAVSPVKSATLP
jgi:hypothetical protein